MTTMKPCILNNTAYILHNTSYHSPEEEEEKIPGIYPILLVMHVLLTIILTTLTFYLLYFLTIRHNIQYILKEERRFSSSNT